MLLSLFRRKTFSFSVNKLCYAQYVNRKTKSCIFVYFRTRLSEEKGRSGCSRGDAKRFARVPGEEHNSNMHVFNLFPILLPKGFFLYSEVDLVI